ncbi:hypothetical protein HaLaN_05189, partial [Haematococcus lacustris]
MQSQQLRLKSSAGPVATAYQDPGCTTQHGTSAEPAAAAAASKAAEQGVAAGAGATSISMADLEVLGYPAQKGKVLVNCLVKLGRADMQGAAHFRLR